MAGMHYVLAADGSGALTPVAATEFARDRAFGFGASRLAEYVEEKSVARGAGRATKAEEVHAITIETIRSGGPEAVAAQADLQHPNPDLNPNPNPNPDPHPNPNPNPSPNPNPNPNRCSRSPRRAGTRALGLG